jgi:hypothetical protein
MQQQKGQSDDVGMCLLQRGKVQKHGFLILRELFSDQLLHV